MFAGVALPPGSAPRAKSENSSLPGFLDCGENRRIHGTAGYHVFATSQRRMRSAIWVAVASGTFVEYLPSRRTQCRLPVGCRTSPRRSDMSKSFSIELLTDVDTRYVRTIRASRNYVCGAILNPTLVKMSRLNISICRDAPIVISFHCFGTNRRALSYSATRPRATSLESTT